MYELLQEELKKEFKPEIRWYRKFLHRLIPLRTRKPLLILFIITELILDVLAIIGVQNGIINFNFQNFQINGYNQAKIQQVGNNNSVVLAESTQCSSKFCSNFDDNKWNGINKFIPIQERPLILKSPTTSQLPGATMFYKEYVKNFIARAFITPQASISANLVLSYGSLYRCILGDADYQLISCQINEDYPKVPENWGYFDQDGTIYGKSKHYQKRPFKQNEEMDIRFEQRKDATNTIISIKINDQVPAEWILPKNFNNKAQLETVGLGLINTKYDDAQAILKHFELDPKL